MILRCTVLGAWLCSGIAAQSSFPVTLTASCAGGGSKFVQGIEPSPTAAFAAVADFGSVVPSDCDATVLFAHACFWRLASDSRLSQFYDSGTPGDQGGITHTISPAGDSWTVRWPDAANRGVLDASWTQTLECFGARSALATSTWQLHNTSAAPIALEFYAYSDLDFGFSFENRTHVASTGDRHVVEHDPSVPSPCPGCAEFWGDAPSSWEIAPWPILEVKLTRSSFAGLSSSGLPFGVDDYTGAMGWSASVSPGATLTITYSHGRNALHCTTTGAAASYGPADPGMTLTARTTPILGAELFVDFTVPPGPPSSSLMFGIAPLAVVIPGCTQTLLVDPLVAAPMTLDASAPCLPVRHSAGLSLDFGRL